MSLLNITPEEINLFFPICGVTAYGKVLVLRRNCRVLPGLEVARGNRRKITKVNKRSLNNFLFRMMTSPIQFASVITLTYGPNFPMNGKLCKRDINQFLIYMKRSFGSFSYAWFLEFQARGAPHFHLITSLEGPGECERDLMAQIWAKIAEPLDLPYTAISSPYGRKRGYMGLSTQDSVFRQHRRQQNWSHIKKSDGAIRYVLKYAAKNYQKKVPKSYSDVGRFWATSRDVAPTKGIEVPMKEDEVRQLIQQLGRDFTKWEVLPKYIFFNNELPNK